MSKFSQTFDRVNISSILSNHLTTFYHYEKLQFYGKKQIPNSDKFLFGILPIFLSIFFCWSGLIFNNNYVNIILTCLSIFVGLLFGLLTMVYNLVQDNQKIDIENINPEDSKKIRSKIDLTIHLFINIAFSVVLSILAIVAVLLTQFHPDKFIKYLHTKEYYDVIKNIYLYITNGTAFFLLLEFLLVIMMIIRRFMVLFLNQVGK